MTHDELLEKIESFNKITTEGMERRTLRAVVELHKPKDFMVETDFPWIGCWECEELYPCPTIKAIEKEMA